MEKQPDDCKTERFIHTEYGYCYYALTTYALIYNLYIEPKYRFKGKSKRLSNLVISEIKHEVGTGVKIFIEAQPKENSISKEELEKYYKTLGLEIF